VWSQPEMQMIPRRVRWTWFVLLKTFWYLRPDRPVHEVLDFAGSILSKEDLRPSDPLRLKTGYKLRQNQGDPYYAQYVSHYPA
jgi:hypothetical protein